MKNWISKAIGNEDRMNILLLLYHNKEMTVSDMLDKLDVPQSYLSQQLAILKSMNIVEGERDGRYVVYSIKSSSAMSLMSLVNKVINVPPCLDLK